MSMGEKEKYGAHIIQHPIEYSLCTGCGSCELLCALYHDGVTGPQHGRIKVKHGELDQIIHKVYTCLQCTDHPCYEACPFKGKAMRINEDGNVYIVEEACVGCGLCAKNCKSEVPVINLVKSSDRTKRKGKKCDLCYGRPGGPLCIEVCPSKCLGLSTDELPYEINERGECVVK